VIALIVAMVVGGASAHRSGSGDASTAVPTAAPTEQTAVPTVAPVVSTGTPIEDLVPKIISVMPHDTSAFTEGLILDHGTFYESTGQYGQSTLRQVDPQTGKVLRAIRLPDVAFGEGLALVGDRLIQLTWKEHTAFVYNRDTFDLIQTFSYTGEGWGLCFDGQDLYMSDGSSTITERDPQTFAPLRQIAVTEGGQPVVNLNELECVGDSLYENVWLTDTIVQIDKATGNVTEAIDAAGLLTPQERSRADVLNGIAYDPNHQTFFITGKYWPWVFEVVFVPKAS